MDIKFLRLMQKNRIIGQRENFGIPETEIVEIETEANVRFPQAYREFLFLGGLGANMISDLNHEVKSFSDGFPFWKGLQSDAREGLEEAGIKIERPFWVFALLDSDQFWFFYLDEGDDPRVQWYCDHHMDENRKVYAGIIEFEMTFSQYIGSAIKYHKQ